MEQKYLHLQLKYDLLLKERDEWKQKANTSKSRISNEHCANFWHEIQIKCRFDPDYVKNLVKNKILTVFDRNSKEETLLMTACYHGQYELVQLCINCGADINAKDKKGKTALDHARRYGYYHIEQLLLFSQMNINIGDEVKNTSDIIHKQNGINYNILNELSLIGDQSKQLFEKIVMELMVNIITKRLSFSDNLLNLCWNIASRKNDPLSSDLWKAISSTCSDIIQNGGKRDWYWLKSCIIPSTVWFNDIHIYTEKKEEKSQDSNTPKPHYLYSELLKLVDIEAKNQLNKLEEDLNKLANENKNNWDKLTTWDIADQYEKVRQDVIPNGIVSRYTYNQLSESSGALFNSPKFYDYNQYLSQLVLLAQIVDDEFQRSVQEMYKIDKVTNEGIIEFDNNMYGNDDEKKNVNDFGDGKIQYIRGPVKLIERARNKAQNDYANEEYPASACILDLNRCALIFNDISTLLAALQLFVNKVKYYQSGNIIGIVRDKNGFIEYVKSTQYADIKLNVLIKGKHNNLIGECQFLLKRMKEFKDKAHNLYAVQRKQESIETSVSNILPILLNDYKQIFIAGNTGNVKKLCELMVINNKSIDDLMKPDKESGNTILHRICSAGHDKAFLFLKSKISKDRFVKYLLSGDVHDKRPIEYCIKNGKVAVAKNIFDIKEICENYRDKNERWRLLYWLFVHNQNHDLTDYIIKILNLANVDIAETINYRYQHKKKSAKGTEYNMISIIGSITSSGTLNTLKKLNELIGEKELCDGVFMRDGWNRNALQRAIKKNKLDMIKYLMHIKMIKAKCVDDMEELHRIISYLNANFNEEIVKYIVNVLDLKEAKLNELKLYRDIDLTRISSINHQ